MEEAKIRSEGGNGGKGGGRQLVIKFKMTVGGNGERVPTDQPVATSTCWCHCGKRFPSRKALTGHVSRVHNSLSSKRDSLSPVKEVKAEAAENPSVDLNRGAEFSCDLCGKVFPSPKSLYGHMRTHPEREWRGMMQPHKPGSIQSRNFDSSIESYVAKKATDPINDGSTNIAAIRPFPEPRLVLDLQKSLPNWSITRKRRRSSSVSMQEDLEKDIEVAQILLSLKNEVIIKSSLVQTDINRGIISSALTLGSGTDIANADHPDTEKQNNNKKRRLNDLEATLPDDSYKSSQTYQSIIGHESIHNKGRITLQNETELMDKNGSSNNNSSECKICNMKFSTGQEALGGQKGLQWTGSPPEAETSGQSPGEPASGTTIQPVVRDFDLNELSMEMQLIST